MCSPLLTIGILGSSFPVDLEYNINTYIGQSFQDFELIFSLDEKQCVPVSDIIDSFNAHNFEIENRVKIFESDANEGIISNAVKIIDEARGKYILFISLEDALYDIDVLKRIQYVLSEEPLSVNSFRTLIHCGEDWVIYPATENKQDTISVCYPRQWVSIADINELKHCRSVSEFGQSLLCHMAAKGMTVNYRDENTIVHISAHTKERLNDYYIQPDVWQDQLDAFLSLSNTQLVMDKLSRNHIEKLIQILNQGVMKEQSVKDELYYVYRLAKESIWEMPDSTKQYLEILKYILDHIRLKANPLSLLRLKRKLHRTQKAKRKKLLFLAHEYSVWPSFKSVYEEALKSQRFDVRLVYVPFFHTFSQLNHEEEIANYRRAGYPIVSSQEYKISEDCPDVVLYVKPYDSIPEEYQVKEIRKIVDTIVYIPYGMEIGDTKECLRYQCYGNMQYYATYILAYSPLYFNKMRHYTYTQGRNYLTIGHPRIDLRQEKLQDTDQYVSFIKRRAQNRKKILWNTHFTISEGNNWGSFLQWGESILNYFKDHNGLFLLWRPHPLFYKALAENRRESLEKTMEWLQKVCDFDNILLDRASSYLTAFQISDAMVSDWGSFVPEYIAYGKPILVTPKKQSTPSILTGSNQTLTIAQNQDDIYRFLDNIQKSEADQEYQVDSSKVLFFPHETTVAKELLKIIE